MEKIVIGIFPYNDNITMTRTILTTLVLRNRGVLLKKINLLLFSVATSPVLGVTSNNTLNTNI